MQPDLATDRSRALELTPVSRETTERLDRLVDLLRTWQQRINLIAPSTEPHLWTRHVADSLQLIPLAGPHARIFADLGSGGGFPGLVVACALAETPGCQVHLIEANTKKAAFLREAIRATGAPALVHAARIEDFLRDHPDGIEVVTARALAPLPTLLTLAYPLLKSGALGLFPKGRDIDRELTDAAKSWNIDLRLVASRTDPGGRILVVNKLNPLP